MFSFPLCRHFAVLFLLGLIMLSSCSELSEGSFDDEEEISSLPAINLSESLARAIKFNASSRTNSFETALSSDIKGENKNSLISLVSSAGYDMRNRAYGPASEDLLEGKIISDKKDDTDMSILQNMLDFATDYNAFWGLDKASPKYIKNVHSKVIQSIICDTKSAFWRAAAAEKNIFDVDKLTVLLNSELLAKEEDGARPEIEVKALEYKKNLHALLHQVALLKQEMLSARMDFALLTNIPVEEKVSLHLDEKDEAYTKIVMPEIANLEATALKNRFEVNLFSSPLKLSAKETTKSAKKLMPNLKLGEDIISGRLPKNIDELEQRVTDISWNIMNVPSQKNEQNKDRKRKLSVNMGILTEVNLAYLRLKDAVKEIEDALKLHNKYAKIWDDAVKAEKSGAITREDLVIAIGNKVIADVKKDFAFAELKSAESSLNLAIGETYFKDIDSKASLAKIHDSITQTPNNAELKVITENKAPIFSPRGNTEGEKWAVGNWLEEVSKQTETSEVKIEQEPGTVSPLISSSDKSGTNSSGEDTVGTALEIELVKESSSDTKEALILTPPLVSEKVKEDKGDKHTAKLQIGAFSDIEKAKNYWFDMEVKYPELSNFLPSYEEVNSSGKHFTRVFIIGEKESLKNFCKTMEEAKLCMLR